MLAGSHQERRSVLSHQERRSAFCFSHNWPLVHYRTAIACACGCYVVAIAMRVLSLLHIRIIYSVSIHRVAVLCIKKLDRDRTRVIYILDIRNICHSFL